MNEWRIDRAGDPGDFLEAANKAVACALSDDRLYAIAVLKDRLPDIERDAVEQAIAAGSSWARIGEALGVSRQAIFKKYGVGAGSSTNPRRRAVVDARAEWEFVKAEQERFAQAHFDRVRKQREEGT